MPSSLVCIFGPTASGKTSLSIELAQKLKSEIISCDSRQFYHELSIGTAKPSPDELSTVRHHFINSLSIDETYTAGQFEEDAIRKIEELLERNEFVFMTGGSGLYAQAVTHGMDEVPGNKQVRSELIEEFKSTGLEPLQQELKETDPEYYEKVDLQNPVRVMRALEVFRSTGKPYSSFRSNEPKPRNFNIIKIGLDWGREALYGRINSRVEQMIIDGLLDEVKQVAKYKDHQALQTVGYRELFPVIDGQYDLDRGVELVKRNTRRYAKRQLTWFRRDKEIMWFKPEEFDQIESYIREQHEH